jgi:hypothetical protein
VPSLTGKYVKGPFVSVAENSCYMSTVTNNCCPGVENKDPLNMTWSSQGLMLFNVFQDMTVKQLEFFAHR